ncbi:MAG: hypothetical protein WA874_06330 [Chryseosolibacter sp.]
MTTPFLLPSEHGKKNALKQLIVTACIVTVADGLAAVVMTYVMHDRPPVFVFQYIASGLLGLDAFSGGLTSAFLGLVIHFLISSTWTLVFFILNRPMSAIISSRLAIGILYGIVIWIFMNLAILPLSRVPEGPRSWQQILTGITALILAAGLPMSFRFERFYSGR